MSFFEKKGPYRDQVRYQFDLTPFRDLEVLSRRFGHRYPASLRPQTKDFVRDRPAEDDAG